MCFFSVVIPLYNKAPYLFQTLQSVCKQTFRDFEIILLDDGSTDDSLREAAKIQDPRLQIHPFENKGVSKARNRGIDLAKSNYIAFLDADDLWTPVHLEEMHTLIKKFPEEQVFSSAVNILKNGVKSKASYSIPSKKYQKLNYFKGSLRTSLLHPSALVIHRELYQKIGGFDPAYQNYEDIDYWFRIGRHSAVAFSSTPTVTLVKTENSLSNRAFRVENHCFLEAYDAVQNEIPEFYRVLNLNRLSLALLCKENACKQEFKTLISKIDFKDLTLRQRLLLQLPAWGLTFLKKIKKFLGKLGCSLVVFR